jgi:hypothetical protein
MVKLCHFCDDINSQNVCTTCNDIMIYKTDVNKIYGLEDDQLTELFVVSHQSGYRRITCHKYHPNDLYNHLLKIINGLSNGKIKDKLLKKKFILDEELKKQQEITKLKESVKSILETCLKKVNQEYLNFYTEFIETLLETLCMSTTRGSPASIALHIFNLVDTQIITNKIQHDKIIAENKKRQKLEEYVNSSDKLIEYSDNIRYGFFSQYISGDETYEKTLIDINNYVETEELKKERVEEANEIIKKYFLKPYHTMCKASQHYKNFIIYGDINQINKLTEELTQLVNTKKEHIKRQKYVTKKTTDSEIELHYMEHVHNICEKYLDLKITTDEFDEMFNELTKRINDVTTFLVENSDIKYTHQVFLDLIVKYIKTGDKTFENFKICMNDILTRKNAIDELLLDDNNDNYKYHHFQNLLNYKKFLSNCTLEKLQEYKIKIIDDIESSHLKNKMNVLRRNPNGSSGLDRLFKENINIMLESVLQKYLPEVIINDVTENNKFFIEMKCGMLGLKYEVEQIDDKFNYLIF